MRWKIIIVNGGVVLLLGLLSYALLATALGDVLANPAARRAEVERAIRSANAQLALDGLSLERWIAGQAATEPIRAVFSVGTSRGRSERATVLANRLRDAVTKHPDISRLAPSLVLFVDAQGVAIGRNGSNLMRGDKMGEAYPSILESLESGQTMSDVWLNRQRQEQMLASYGPVRNENDEVVGAVIIGTPLNDERLGRTSNLTSGRPLVLGVRTEGGALEMLAKSGESDRETLAAAGSPAVVEAVAASLGSGDISVVAGVHDSYVVGTAPLAGFGAGSGAAIISAVPASLVPSLAGLLWPLFAVTALGLALVVAGGVILGNYISSPISEVEEGLLQVINGKTDLRFQIEHPDLGGLIFRINSLLNALMGVPETDEEGRTSVAPQARTFQEP